MLIVPQSFLLAKLKYKKKEIRRKGFVCGLFVTEIKFY